MAGVGRKWRQLYLNNKKNVKRKICLYNGYLGDTVLRRSLKKVHLNVLYLGCS